MLKTPFSIPRGPQVAINALRLYMMLTQGRLNCVNPIGEKLVRQKRIFLANTHYFSPSGAVNFY